MECFMDLEKRLYFLILFNVNSLEIRTNGEMNVELGKERNV